jgi:dTDP-4-dehydrorhamnose 3,5-epimerase
MILTALPLPGAYRIEPELHTDERGFFTRLWCAQEFAAHGLHTNFVQSSISSNRLRGSLRGLHYQADPYGETKLVRCIRGAAFDCLVDLRPTSPTYKQWCAVELTADNRLAVYIPAGFAHGFQTLADDTELLYEITAYFSPSHTAGIRWNDSQLAIAWPLPHTPILSARDANLPYLPTCPLTPDP